MVDGVKDKVSILRPWDMLRVCLSVKDQRWFLQRAGNMSNARVDREHSICMCYEE